MMLQQSIAQTGFLIGLLMLSGLPTLSCAQQAASEPPWGYEDESKYLITTPVSLQFGEVELLAPMGTAFNGEQIVVADCGKHQILWFSLSGKLTRTLGARGPGEGEFNCPTRIAFDADQQLWVVDSGNHRLQVFSPEGKVIQVVDDFDRPADVSIRGNKVWVTDQQAIYQFARNELPKPQWTYLASGAKSITIDDDGRSYVLNRDDHQITVLDTHGAVSRRFGGFGKRRLNFAFPTGIRFFQGLLYIADQGNHRYQVLKTDGSFVSSWGEHPPHNHLDAKHIHFPEQMSYSRLGMVDCDPFQHLCQYSSLEQVRQWQQLDNGWETPPNYSPHSRLMGSGDTIALSDPIAQQLQFFTLRAGALTPIGFLSANSPMLLSFVDQKFTYLDQRAGVIRQYGLTDGALLSGWQRLIEDLKKKAVDKGCKLGSVVKLIGLDDKIQLLVDELHHQLLVANTDLSEIVGCWGGFGTQVGQLNAPVDGLVVGENLYLVEKLNHRLQQIKWSIDKSGTVQFNPVAVSDGSFTLPSAVALSDRQLVIADLSSTTYRVLDLTLKEKTPWNTIQSRAELQLPAHQLATLASGEVMALTPGHHIGEVLSSGFVYYEVGVGEYSRFDYFTSEWQLQPLPELKLMAPSAR